MQPQYRFTDDDFKLVKKGIAAGNETAAKAYEAFTDDEKKYLDALPLEDVVEEGRGTAEVSKQRKANIEAGVGNTKVPENDNNLLQEVMNPSTQVGVVMGESGGGVGGRGENVRQGMSGPDLFATASKYWDEMRKGAGMRKDQKFIPPLTEEQIPGQYMPWQQPESVLGYGEGGRWGRTKRLVANTFVSLYNNSAGGVIELADEVKDNLLYTPTAFMKATKGVATYPFDYQKSMQYFEEAFKELDDTYRDVKDLAVGVADIASNTLGAMTTPVVKPYADLVGVQTPNFGDNLIEYTEHDPAGMLILTGSILKGVATAGQIRTLKAIRKMNYPYGKISDAHLLDIVTNYGDRKAAAIQHVNDLLHETFPDSGVGARNTSLFMDELALAHPELSPRALRDAIQVNGIEWAVEEIARARAMNGVAKFPNLTPNGSFVASTSLRRLKRASNNLYNAFKEEARSPFRYTDQAVWDMPNVEAVPVREVAQYLEFDRADDPSIPGLAEDIRKNGVQEPLIVVYDESTGRVHLGEGNHRVAAALEVDPDMSLPVKVVKEASWTPDERALPRKKAPKKPEKWDSLPGKPLHKLTHYGRGDKGRGRGTVDPADQGKGQMGRERDRAGRVPRNYWYAEGSTVEARFRNRPYSEAYVPEDTIENIEKVRRPYKEVFEEDGTYDIQGETTRAEKLHAEQGKHSLAEQGKLKVVQTYKSIRTIVSIVDEVISSTEKGGTSFSFSRQRAMVPEDGGFMVGGIDGGKRVQVIPLAEWKKNATELLKKFVEDNKDILGGDDVVLGTWEHEGNIYLEPSQFVKSEKEAIRLGKRRGEQAYWDNELSLERKLGDGEKFSTSPEAAPNEIGLTATHPSTYKTSFPSAPPSFDASWARSPKTPYLRALGREEAHVRESVSRLLGVDVNSWETRNWMETWADLTRKGKIGIGEVLDRTAPLGASLEARFGEKGLGVLENGMRAAAGREAATLRGLTIYNDIMNLFTEGGRLKPKSLSVLERKRKFADFLLHERSEALRLRRAAIESRVAGIERKISEWQSDPNLHRHLSLDEYVSQKDIDFAKEWRENPDPQPNIPRMSEEALAEFLSDPANVKAVELWREQTNPLFEQINENIGVEKSLNSPNNVYHHVTYYAPGEVQGGRLKRGRYLTPIIDPNRTPSLSRRKASSARKAVGVIPEGYLIEADLRQMIHDTMMDKIPANARFDFISQLVDVARDYRNMQPGDVITALDGKKVRLRKVKLDKPHPKSPDGTLLLPEDIAKVYEAVAEKGNYAPSSVDVVSSLVTSTALLVPAEASMHALGIVSALLEYPGWGKSALAQTLGDVHLGFRAINMLADVWRLDPDHLRADLQRTTELGGQRISHYEWGVTDGRGKMPIMEALRHWDTASLKGHVYDLGHVVQEKVPILKAPKDAVFGNPMDGRAAGSWWGFESRARVALFRLIKKLEPGLDDATAVMRMNDLIGTYNKSFEPALVRKMKLVDPFARAGMALTKTGVKANADLLRPLSARRNFMMKWSTFMTYVYLHTLLDSKRTDERYKTDGTVAEMGKGRLPTETPGMKLGDIRIPLMDGTERTMDIPFQLWQNTANRGFNATGVKAIYDATVAGEDRPEKIFDWWVHGLRNFAQGRMGPPIRAAYKATFGKILYSPGPGQENLPATQHDPTKSRALENLKSATIGLFPFVEKPYEMLYTHHSAHPHTPVGKAMATTAKSFGLNFKLHEPGFEAGQLAKKSRADKREWDEWLTGVVWQAGNQPQDQQWAFIEEKFATQDFPTEYLRWEIYMQAFQMYENKITSLPARQQQEMLDRMGIEAPWLFK